MNDKMKCIDKLPYEIEAHENIWIPMRDGVKLAARLWLPKEAKATPMPAIVEYIPYRKREFKRLRDSQIHPYFAGHGYACLRVDLRGSGDSEGILHDEYLPTELEDGVDILRWLGQQAWCDGNVGIIGISWGGFNGLQIAAMQPPELKAIITLCSTDDRYADDIHHMGGCLLGDNLSWASVMFSYNSLPPDPQIVGDRWQQIWMERLQNNEPWIIEWLQHQTRDEFWKHGSICENYSDVQIPVFAVSGWADGYSNAVFRMLKKLQGPRLGLVGPWSHKYPHLGIPGPTIGFLQESLRWWDKWLKGIETGIMQEPMLRAWMQDSVPPVTYYDYRPGRWVGEREWPSIQVEDTKMLFSHGRIRRPEIHKVKEKKLTLQSPLTVGLFAGKWCAYGAGPDLAHDQRQEDGGALVFDSSPLKENCEILGAPKVILDLSSNQPNAMIAVRLSDVSPSGEATRITYGLLNLTHRESNEFPKELEPGKRYQVEVKLNDIAQVFPVGHRIRISVSTSYWPLAWPSPQPVQIKFYIGKSHLLLPVRTLESQAEDDKISFEPSVATPVTPYQILEPHNHNWSVHRDLASDVSSLIVTNNHGNIYFEEIDLAMTNKAVVTYSCRASDFDSVQGETHWTKVLKRGNDWHIKTITKTKLTSNKHEFRIQADLDAFQNDTRVFCKSWEKTIPRNFV